MQLPKGRSLIVLLAAIVALVVPIILLENNVLRHTNGNIAFPLDSAFLDISVGKNLAFYSVWGVSKYAFQSASTSLLYPVLLAVIFFVIGSHLIIPIVLNGVAAICFVYALQQALIHRGIKPLHQLIILLAVIFLAPLPLMVVSGMGYTVQLLFCFLFMESLATAIDQGVSQLPRRVYLYGLLAVATRYEDIVLVALACLLLVSINRRREALQLAGISLLPPVLFGVISLSKGSYFLPNSLVLGPYPSYILYLAIAGLIIGCLFIWQYRQLAVGPVEGRGTIRPRTSIYRLSFALLTVLGLPFIARNIATLRHFEGDSIRIYEQQYPMAAFVHRYYHRQTIGVNNIGAVAWFSDGRKLDFTGEASADVIKSQREHSWGPVLADSLSRKDGVRAAIVSDPWFSPGELPKWSKVASWKLPDTQSSSGEVLNFYGINNDTSWLRKSLHDYELYLPARIAVKYY
ncbi:hypothetical protein [Puia dinghuensis]|uniref:Uncharacterized protein n=1 Tax=Puia dinghuensis TaxID=1792502 RepID=A0A8J2UHR6_9BACT|nr:hypothetical protein [Puia dinghuensis]GGB19734.1 hypothetical protein GCM10011511_49340 [Puia dinghuensis]